MGSVSSGTITVVGNETLELGMDIIAGTSLKEDVILVWDNWVGEGGAVDVEIRVE